jgi:hypothetical protein
MGVANPPRVFVVNVLLTPTGASVKETLWRVMPLGEGEGVDRGGLGVFLVPVEYLSVLLLLLPSGDTAESSSKT